MPPACGSLLVDTTMFAVRSESSFMEIHFINKLQIKWKAARVEVFTVNKNQLWSNSIQLPIEHQCMDVCLLWDHWIINLYCKRNSFSRILNFTSTSTSLHRVKIWYGLGVQVRVFSLFIDFSQVQCIIWPKITSFLNDTIVIKFQTQ